MSSPKFEAFLAKIYTDEKDRMNFLSDPRAEAIRAGLSEPEIVAVENIDLVGLELTVRSLNHKRHQGREEETH